MSLNGIQSLQLAQCLQIQLRSSNNDKVIFENYGGELQPIRTAIIVVVVCIVYKAIFLFV